MKTKIITHCKQLFMLLAIGFTILGCTQKTASNIKPYVTLNQNSTQNIKLNFVSVTDQRTTKNTGFIIQNDKTINKYPITVNAASWYHDAFLRELKTTNMYTRDSNTKIKLTVNIKKIKAIYQKYSLSKKNMSVIVSLELVIISENKTTKLNLNINQSMYKPMIADAQGFESILNESMKDSVSKAVTMLIQKLN